MDWNEYRAEHEKARFDPSFSRRVLAASALQNRKERTVMTHNTHLARRGLIAAVLALALCISTFAAVYTNYDLIRDHLGIHGADPIPEYAEYTDGNENNKLKLISTLRSGESMNVYVEVSPIDHAYEGYTLEQNNEAYMLLGKVSHGEHCGAEVISYEASTETALVELWISPLGDCTELEVALELMKGGERIAYGPVTVPVTENDARNAYFDVPLTTALGRGSLNHAAVGTNTIVASFDFPAYLTWEDAIEYDEELAKLSGEGKSDWGLHFSEAQHLYMGTWLDSAKEAMADARLEFADGSSVQITELEPMLFNVWYPGPGSVPVEDFSSLSIMYMMAEALDLRTVTGICIGGVTYPLIAE